MYDVNLMKSGIEAATIVRSLRDGADLTQHELAVRLGTDQAAVSRWERGRDEPRLRTLEQIAAACGRQLEIRVVDDGVDRAQLRENLELSPADRIASVRNLSSFRARAQRR